MDLIASNCDIHTGTNSHEQKSLQPPITFTFIAEKKWACHRLTSTSARRNKLSAVIWNIKHSAIHMYIHWRNFSYESFPERKVFQKCRYILSNLLLPSLKEGCHISISLAQDCIPKSLVRLAQWVWRNNYYMSFHFNITAIILALSGEWVFIWINFLYIRMLIKISPLHDTGERNCKT